MAEGLRVKAAMQFSERWSPCGSAASGAQLSEALMSGAEDISEISRVRQVSSPTPASHLLPGWRSLAQEAAEPLPGAPRTSQDQAGCQASGDRQEFPARRREIT